MQRSRVIEFYCKDCMTDTFQGNAIYIFGGQDTQPIEIWRLQSDGSFETQVTSINLSNYREYAYVFDIREDEYND